MGGGGGEESQCVKQRVFTSFRHLNILGFWLLKKKLTKGSLPLNFAFALTISTHVI